MRKTIFFLFCFHLTFFATAQDHSLDHYISEYAYIYKLNPADVYALHVKKETKHMQRYFHTLMDSVKTKGLHTYSFPIGNYLIVYAERENLKIEEKTVRNIFPQWMSNGKDFQLLVLDEKGNTVRQAQVMLDGERIAFDSQRQYYFKSNMRKSGVVKISYGNNFICEKVDVWEDKKKLDHYVNKVIVSVKRALEKSKGKVETGYLLTSKPMYRPGDTVKVKVLAYNSRKPYRKRASLFLSYTDNKGYKEIRTRLAELIPDEEGNFLFRFKLSDTLLSDKQYTLSLKNKKLTIENRFLLKDYRLEDYIFRTNPVKKNYGPQDTIVFYFDAHDVFGNALDDARVRIQVTTQRLTVKESMPDYVSFTIMDSTLMLSSGINNRLVIPRNVLPKVAGAFLVHLSFSDAQHHSKKETLEFSVEDNADYFIAHREDSLMVIEHIRNGQSIVSSCILFFYGNGFQKTIGLPFKGYIHPCLTPTRIMHEDQDYPLFTSDQEPPGFECRKTDTGYMFRSVNPHHIPFGYQLFRHKKCIAEGYTSDYSFDVPKDDKRVYTIKAQYFLNGYQETSKVSTPSNEEMKINAAIPAYVKPGDTALLAITVTDKKKRPVKNLNITASALDAKFKTIHYPDFRSESSEISIPIKKSHFNPGSVFQASESMPASWNKIFHVDTSLYYRYIHPPHNGFYHYMESGDTTAEFAPHVVNDKQACWMYYILLDDRPVYFSHQEYETIQESIIPFSFCGTPGYHRISIRTKDHLIELDSVLLIAGKKLDFSLDIGLKHQSKCRITKVGNKLSKEEVIRLDANRVYFVNHLKEPVIVNLGYTKVRVEKSRSFILFHDQPAFIHHTGRMDTVRIKDKNSIDIHESGIFTAFDSKKKPVIYRGYSLSKSPNYGLHQRPKDLMKRVYYDPASFKETLVWPNVQYEGNKTSTGRGTFFLNNYLSQPWLSYALVGMDSACSFRDEIYPLIYDVNPGKYELTVRYDSLHTFHQPVWIRENEMTVIDAKQLIRNAAFVSQTEKHPEISESFDKINIQQYKHDYRYNRQPDRPAQYRSSFSYSNHRSGRLRFNPMNRYVMIGGGLTMTQWDIDQSGWQPQQFISLELFAAGKFTPRITGELNLQYIHANQQNSYNNFVTKQLILSSFVYVDLFGNRGRSPKRADWTPFLKTGFSAFLALDTYSNAAAEPSWIQPMIPAGLGLRYKFAKQIDLSVSAVRYINLLGGTYSDRSLGSFNQLETSVIFIVPAKVICPKFRDGSARTLYSYVYIEDKQAISKNNVKNDSNSVPLKVRASFNDLAYWEPVLKTDRQGKVSYKVKFPEDITVWKNYIIGVGKHNQRFTKVDYISAILPLTVKLNTPRFLIAQDSFTVYGQLLNATPQLGIDVHCTIQSGERVVEKDTLLIRKSTVKAKFMANSIDSVTVQGIVKSNAVGNDGESVQLPVFLPGVLTAKGVAFCTAGDTSFTFSTGSIVHGKLIINPSAMDDMLKDLEKLKEYPYACMEQTASKLKGLLLLKSISKMRGQVFKGENEIRQLLKRLDDHQQPNGSWGWWSTGSDETLTAYITLVLKQADSMGYEGGGYKRSLNYLKHFEKDSVIKINVLLTLSEMKEALDSNTLNLLQQQKYKSDLDVISRMRILQLNKRAYDIQELLALVKRNALGGIYWGGETWDWRSNQIPATLLAYKIIKQHGGQEQLLAEIRHYLYAVRENGYWRNTVETATIVDLLWREMKPDSTLLKAELSVNRQRVTLPYVETLRSNQSYTVNYTADQPLFVSYYMEQWNSLPEKEGNNFKISTQFMQDGQAVASLVAGQQYLLAVHIDVEKSASYVMIEVPIPAGCLPGDNYSAGENESHRENFKEKTNIYLSHAAIGRYTYYVPVKAGYAGLYTMNPAKVSLMYFPALFGQESLKKVRIEER